MKVTAAIIGFFAIVSGLAWRQAWLSEANAYADRLIAKNRFRRRPGMDTMDESLRDQTTQRQRDRANAIQAFTRELDKPARRLHRAS